MGRISSLLNDTVQYSTLIKSEIGGGKILWEAKMLYCFLRYGAKPVDYWRFQFWRKSASEYDNYLTSMRYSKAYKKLKREQGDNKISGDKFAEYRLFSEFIKREWMEVTKTIPYSMIESFIEKHNCVIAKPNKGEQGQGVIKIFANDKEAIQSLLRAKAIDEYVLEECLVNTPDISEINPSSLNTIRATTFMIEMKCPAGHDMFQSFNNLVYTFFKH